MAETDPNHAAPIWGVSAEFDTPEALLDAIRTLRSHAVGRLDAFTPVPVPGIAEALALHEQPASLIALLGAIGGGAAMLGLCAYATVIAYPFNIGGRPQFSWPAFVVPSFSFAMLTGALTAFAAMLARCRLPRLNHPAFNIPGFTRATQDRFFLAVEASDHGLDAAAVEGVLNTLALAPRRVARVPR